MTTTDAATREAKSIEFIFHPRSIAVAGASADPRKFGRNFVRALLEFQFPGPIYPVNRSGEEVLGLKAYANLRDIPGTVDYVVSSVPRESLLELLEDCAAKGVRVVHMFTAGFSETGEEDGAKLEQQILHKAASLNIRLIGPNCMGIYCPNSHMSFNAFFPKAGGTIGILSQSGGNASELAHHGGARGIRFSKVISFGNALDLNESDFLEYLTDDPETQIIGAYLEGTKDGRRLFGALERAAAAKPVILLKGGRTGAGTRAVASHTGSLAGDDEMWNALSKQLGIVRVYSIDEILDMVLAFLYMPVPQGYNVAVVGGGGGASVAAADVCESAGLSLPTIPIDAAEELRQFIRLAGTSVRNPIDAWNMSRREFRDTVRIISSVPQVDFLINHLNIGPDLFDPSRSEREGRLDSVAQGFIDALQASLKPVAVVLRNTGYPQQTQAAYEVAQRVLKAGFPVYPSLASAALATSRYIEYHQRRAGQSP